MIGHTGYGFLLIVSKVPYAYESVYNLPYSMIYKVETCGSCDEFLLHPPILAP
jgi:hypothetical protein